MTSVNSAGTLIGIRDLKVDFRLDKTTISQAVKGISFDIPVNSTVALVGESGCGKSTVAKVVMGLETATAGEVIWQGKNLARLPVTKRTLAQRQRKGSGE